MHVNVLTHLDDATRSRVVGAFTAALAAHRTADGAVAFNSRYAVITAGAADSTLNHTAWYRIPRPIASRISGRAACANASASTP